MLRKRVHRLLPEIDVPVQPDRRAGQAFGLAVIAVCRAPERGGLFPLDLDALRAEKRQELRAALAVCTLRQHGERKIEAQRRIDAVFSVCSGKILLRRGQEKRLHSIAPAVIQRQTVGAVVLPRFVGGVVRLHVERSVLGLIVLKIGPLHRLRKLRLCKQHSICIRRIRRPRLSHSVLCACGTCRKRAKARQHKTPS